MLANGVKVTSTSSGTGNLTVAGVVGLAAPMDAGFQIGQLFSYSATTVASGADIFREAGWGYMTSATTLVRARVTSKSDGTSFYSNGNLTPTDFGGSTVSIFITPHSASMMSIMPTVDGQSSGINRFITSAGRTVQNSPQQPSSLVAYYVPFLLRCGGLINSLACNITTAGSAGSVARLGIYGITEKGYIGKQLVTTADIDITSTGLKNSALATPLMLPGGDYFTAFVTNSTTAMGLTGYTTAGNQILGGGPLGYSTINPIEFRSEAVATAVLPVTPSLTTNSTTVGAFHPPCVFLGMQ